MNTINELTTGTGLRGARIQAEYHEPLLPEQRDNPLLEAFDPSYSPQEASDAMSHYIPFEPAVRQYPAFLRCQSVHTIRALFQPGDFHVARFLKVDESLRNGLIGRNPYRDGTIRLGEPPAKQNRTAPTSYAQKLQAAKKIARDLALVRGTALVAPSGMGKTTLMESILTSYPQVIEHSQYRGSDFVFNHIVWLMLECPHNGSEISLIHSILNEIDDLLDTNYSKTHGVGTRPHLISQLEQVNKRLRIGLIVLDEIQRLMNVIGRRPYELLEFLVQFSNSVRVPIVLVGTNQAKPLFATALQHGRRVSAKGDIEWPLPMETLDTGELHPDWSQLLNTLFQYQFVRTPTPVDKALSNALYEKTQGITDLVVTLFILCQERLMMTAKSDKEEVLTPALIRQVADEEFRLLMPAIQAIAKKETNALARYEDLKRLFDETSPKRIPPSQAVVIIGETSQPVEPSINEGSDELVPSSPPKAASAATTVEPTIVEQSAVALPENTGDKSGLTEHTESPPKAVKRKPKADKVIITDPGDLRYTDSGKSPQVNQTYDSLQKRGFVGQSSEYVPRPNDNP